MLRMLLISVFFFCFLAVNGQVISHFEFDNNPVTNATVGPDATSISTSATSSPDGVGGTNGLNAGLPKMDIEMTIPGSVIFDINGIDVSFDFQRDEDGGTFFERGKSLTIKGISNLSVSYKVEDGAGSYVLINSGDIYNIPDDDIFRNYKFVYTPCDGLGRVYVDDSLVWINDGPDNRNMFWSGGDIIIGKGIDGFGMDKTIMDNLIIGEVYCSPLSVDFNDVSANINDYRQVDINWTTQSESNNDYFVVERDSGNNKWDSLGTVQGTGNSNQLVNYSYIDEYPHHDTLYYRINQVDYNGKFSYSSIVTATFEKTRINVSPNPSNGVFNLYWASSYKAKINTIKVQNNFGEVVMLKKNIKGTSTLLDLSKQSPGVYYVIVGNQSVKLMKN